MIVNHWSKSWGSWLLVIAAVSLAGCGDVPSTYPVSGKVVRQNGKAWSGGTITFQLIKEPALNATGEIQKDGSFSLTTHYVSRNSGGSKPGAPVGEYSVTVEPSYGDELPNSIKGNSISKTFTVTEGENNFVVEVE